MGIVIAQETRKPSLNVELVYEWYHQEYGEECPIDLSYIRREAEKYGINWLGVFVIAFLNTHRFTHEYYSKQNCFLGIDKYFFNREEGLKALVQYVALLGGSPRVANMPSYLFVLPSLSKDRQVLFGSIPTFEKYQVMQGNWSKLYDKIASYCHAHYSAEHNIQTTSQETVAAEQSPVAQRPVLLLKPLAATVGKVAWALLVKYFPWLGWLSFLVYYLIDFITK